MTQFVPICKRKICLQMLNISYLHNMFENKHALPAASGLSGARYSDFQFMPNIYEWLLKMKGFNCIDIH